MTDFTDFSKTRIPAIERRLKQLLRPVGKDDRLLESLGTLVSRGGKRLRPLLFLAAYDGYGGSRQLPAVSVAAGLELLHAFLLIHDDIIDRDTERWGGPNIAGHYFEQYSGYLSPPEAWHFAAAQSLLAGDLCWNLALQAIDDSGFKAAELLPLHAVIRSTLSAVLAAEATEVNYSQQATMPNEADVLRLYADKTASYSFALPLLCAAMLTGQPAAEQKRLHRLAHKLGVAFQLQDDLLGVFGDRQVTGKSASGDLREGKRTVMLVRAYSAASSVQRQQIQAMLNAGSPTASQLAAVRRIIAASGAKANVEKQIHDLFAQVQEELAASKLSVNCQKWLADFIAALHDREY